MSFCTSAFKLEALQMLVGSVKENNEFLNSKEQKCGNTILHLAVMLKQIEDVRLIGLQTQEHDNPVPASSSSSSSSSSSIIDNKPSASERASASCYWKYWWSQFIGYLKTYDVDWIKDRSGALMMVVILIATMTFQAALNPPGGVWQQNTNTTELSHGFDCGVGDRCLAGTAVLPNLYRLCTWLFNLAICIAVTFTALTFMEGVYLVLHIDIKNLVYKIYEGLFYSWNGLFGIVILVHTIRMLFQPVINWSASLIHQIQITHTFRRPSQISNIPLCCKSSCCLAT
nr:uncharacterized protein LOC112490563 [Ziziphus jujuba var. spinosa]